MKNKLSLLLLLVALMPHEHIKGTTKCAPLADQLENCVTSNCKATADQLDACVKASDLNSPDACSSEDEAHQNCIKTQCESKRTDYKKCVKKLNDELKACEHGCESVYPCEKPTIQEEMSAPAFALLEKQKKCPHYAEQKKCKKNCWQAQ